MNHDIETLALIVYTARHRSRRQAKRLLREAGGAGTAEELDKVLAHIADHSQLAEIERNVRELTAAAVEAEMTKQEPAKLGSDHPHWLVAEDARSDRAFVLYLGTDCAFLAEIFDDADECRETAVLTRLDDGQVLGNVLWLDEPPEPERQAALWLEARRALRVYDKRLGL